VMMIDIDGFKEMNDLYGHAAGDRMLKDLARVLNRSIRTSDNAIRIGGDEFIILLPKTNDDVLRDVIVRIQTSLDTFNSNQDPLHNIQVSIGTSTAHNLDELLVAAREADLSMYREKRGKKEKPGE
jgi:two-component system, cell cycle response regulator